MTEVATPGARRPIATPTSDTTTVEARGLGRPVRLALYLDSYEVAAWTAAVLDAVLADGTAQIALVVLNVAEAEATASAEPRTLARRMRAWWRNRDRLPYELYLKLDARRYAVPHSPFRGVDLTERLADVPVVRVRPRQTKFCDYFPDDAVEAIRAHDVDVALRLGFRILKGASLDVARYGVWSFHHGDNTVNRGGPPGFWEVMEGHATTGAVLQRLTEELDGGVVLARATASTNPISVTTNKANYYWQASALLVRALRRLRAEGAAGIADTDAPTVGWTAYDRRLYTAPSAREMLGLGLRLALRLVRSRVRAALTREQWIMAFRMAPGGSRSAVPDGVAFRFKELRSPADRFWADPFPVFHDGTHYLFFEEQPAAHPNAHICVVEMDAQGMRGEPRVALRRDYHLSYPALFQWEGTWYMTPETASQRAVQLFRATRFPDEWEYVGDLLRDLDAVDPTICEIDGRWWMFLGVVLPGASEATALHLYTADTPLGPWRPHPHNPVKVDVRGARPAGWPFRHEGVWYRPAQDGAPRYGSATIVHRIETLDEHAFSEVPVSRLMPSWRPGLVGTHTLNAQGGLTVIDAREVRWRWQPARPTRGGA